MSRLDRGVAKFNEIYGPGNAENLIGKYDGPAKDLIRYAIAYEFADIYSRPVLTLAQREIVALAALTTMGCVDAQLKGHTKAAVAGGLSGEAISEIVIATAQFSGFTRALWAINVVAEQLTTMGIEIPEPMGDLDAASRRERADGSFDATYGAGSAAGLVGRQAGPTRDLFRYTLDFAYGDVFPRPGLTPAEREIVAIVLMTMMDGVDHELRGHTKGALKAGLTPAEVLEVVITSVQFFGFTRGLRAVLVASAAIEELGYPLPAAMSDAEIDGE